MSERIQGVKETDYNGRHYRSTLEAETAKVLDSLGIPFEYESRKIVLQEGFRCPYQKDKVRDLTYTADFIIGPIMLECKGFETPEWKIKKKLLFKWLMENEPSIIFHQTHDSKKDLLKALDPHLTFFGYYVEVSSRPTRKKSSEVFKFDSIEEALSELNLKGKNIGPILRSLTGQTQWVYGYNWKLVKITI
jgi:hypothetical protein